MGLSELRDRRSGGGSEEIADSGLAGERGQYAHAARIGRLCGRRRRCGGHAYERDRARGEEQLRAGHLFPLCERLRGDPHPIRVAGA